MGAYKYLRELYKKKQSDVLLFTSRLNAWEYRRLPAICRLSRPSRPEKAHSLGYKSKQGFVVFRVKVRRGGRRRVANKGRVNGKPKNHGIRKLKSKLSSRTKAEVQVGKLCNNLRVLNSYWICQDAVYKYYEVILVDPFHKVVRRDPRINWICNAVMKHREMRGLTSSGQKSRRIGKGHRFKDTKGGSVSSSWKRRNTLSLRRYR